MRFPCHLESRPDGRWTARTTSSIVGVVAVTADDQSNAIDKLRAEIRYRLELCPCSGVGDDYVELDIRT